MEYNYVIQICFNETFFDEYKINKAKIDVFLNKQKSSIHMQRLYITINIWHMFMNCILRVIKG